MTFYQNGVSYGTLLLSMVACLIFGAVIGYLIFGGSL